MTSSPLMRAVTRNGIAIIFFVLVFAIVSLLNLEYRTKTLSGLRLSDLERLFVPTAVASGSGGGGGCSVVLQDCVYYGWTYYCLDQPGLGPACLPCGPGCGSVYAKPTRQDDLRVKF